MRRWRITSSVIGSTELSQASCINSPLPAADADFPERPDLERIAGPEQCGRAIFFDQSRSGGLEAGSQCAALVDVGVEESAAPEIHRPPVGRARARGQARQPRELGPLEPREGGEMQGLQ